MTKKKLVVVGLGAIASLTGLITCELKKRKRINQLEEAMSGLILTQESMLRFQAEKNADFEERLEYLVEELGSVYGHFEYMEVKKDEQ